MKLGSLFLLTASLLMPVDDTSHLNKLKKRAAQALLEEDHELASQTYAYLVDTLYAPDPKGHMRLNLAHAHLKRGDTLSALNQYQELSQRVRSGPVSAEALNQMGLLSHSKQQRTLALNLFKNALKADPTHEKARYNYQVVKKSLENNPESSQPQKNDDNSKDNSEKSEKDNPQQGKQDQENQQESQENQQEGEEQQKQESSSQEGEKQEDGEKQDETSSEEKEQQGEQKESAEEQLAKKLEDMNLSEEKANMILDALRNNELQYIQQLKRRSSRPRKTEKDW